MNIKTTSAYLPFYDQNKQLTQEENSFVTLLAEDKEFENTVVQLRKVYGIPKEGYPDINMHGNPDSEIDRLFKESRRVYDHEPKPEQLKLAGIKDDLGLLYRDAESICREYGLTPSWKTPLATFITFGVLPVPSKPYPIAVYPRRGTHRWYAETSDSILIAIEQPISKAQFKKWIDANWESLKPEINSLPKHPRSQVRNLKVYQRIAQLENQKLSLKEIAGKLYSEGLINLYDSGVGTYAKRGKAILKK